MVASEFFCTEKLSFDCEVMSACEFDLGLFFHQQNCDRHQSLADFGAGFSLNSVFYCFLGSQDDFFVDKLATAFYPAERCKFARKESAT